MSAGLRQRGFTLIEMMIAITIAALIVAGLNGFVMAGLDAKASVRQTNELIYQGGFAMDRMIAAARATPQKVISPPTLANSTGDWFAPTMYCVKGGNRLVETTVSDTSCTGSNTIASNVVAISAQLPGGAGPVDDPVGTITLTLQSGPASVVLSRTFRLGGGTL
jgi:prepilin-type N-terminal cleavage/methylation domain-containing protein